MLGPRPSSWLGRNHAATLADLGVAAEFLVRLGAIYVVADFAAVAK
jgi:hypothetical protein